MIKAYFFWLATATTVLAATKSPAPAAPAPKFTQPTYYYTIDIDPQYQFTGMGELTEEDAAKAKCYRFAYDSDGRVQQIEYRSAGVPMPDPLLGVTRIDFERAPGIERRLFRDTHSKPMRNLFGIDGEELTLNAAGFPTAITDLDESGGKTRDSAGVIKYVRTLDNLNRVVSARRIGLLGTEITDGDGFFESRTVYDLQGRAIERGNYDSSGNPLDDDDGVATTRTTYTIYPDSTQTTESYFDASGLAAEEKSTGIHQRQRTVDNRGFLIDEAYFDATGAPSTMLKTDVHEVRRTYDDRGNQITEEYLDVNGQPVNLGDAGSYAKVAYKYDNLNRVVELDYFGDDGKPQVPLKVGAAVIRQEYDKDGNVARLQFFDGQGHPSRHATYGVDAIRSRVDGDTTYVQLLNDHDGPMKNPVNGYYAFSYKTDSDYPVSKFNTFYDRHGRRMTLLRVFVINPHLHALKTNSEMYWSARIGVGAGGLGALLGCFLALRKSYHTKRRRVYVPSPLLRFLGWLSVFAILEGALRFVQTIYWAWVGYQNGQMGNGIYVLEIIFICFFLYRLYRLTVTMRVLNITSEDLMGMVREFFTKASLKPEWIAARNRFVTPPLDVRVNYFKGKNHGYLGLTSRGKEGDKLAVDLAAYIRAESRTLTAPVRTRALALYYPSVALCYFLLAMLALYTLSQLIIGF